jgi:hypothetical protein
VVEHLPSKHEALSSNPSIAKKPKNRAKQNPKNKNKTQTLDLEY